METPENLTQSTQTDGCDIEFASIDPSSSFCDQRAKQWDEWAQKMLTTVI